MPYNVPDAGKTENDPHVFSQLSKSLVSVDFQMEIKYEGMEEV
jgi:hypothetical protein